jgi:hypothetical protein
MAKAKTKTVSKKRVTATEMDSVFVLKMALFLILGSQWLYIVDSTSSSQIPIPVGAVIGLIFASQEHFKIDRKIEYVILLIAMFIGFWLPMGITILR